MRKTLSINMLIMMLIAEHYDTQYNDTYPKDTEHDYAQHNGNEDNTQHKHTYNDADC
jgi:hypothetical protein